MVLFNITPFGIMSTSTHIDFLGMQKRADIVTQAIAALLSPAARGLGSHQVANKECLAAGFETRRIRAHKGAMIETRFVWETERIEPKTGCPSRPVGRCYLGGSPCADADQAPGHPWPGLHDLLGVTLRSDRRSWSCRHFS